MPRRPDKTPAKDSIAPLALGGPDASDERAGVQSVEIAVKILTTLAAEGGVLPLKRLAAATKMPRAKVHRYLVSLRRSGLVAQDPTSGEYRIGATSVMVGLVGLQSLNPIRQIYETLPAVRDRVNETVTMAIWGDSGPVIIAMEESSHVVTMNVRIGSVLPLLSTAIGKVFAAHLPASATQPLIDAERKRGPGPAGRLPTTTDFAAALTDIRARGVSNTQGTLLAGVNALAAPVFDHRGKLLAVLCVVGSAATLDIDVNSRTARTLKEAAAGLSRQLGYVAPPVR